ncbi:SRPBCC domain-containing protein [Methylomonas montana]|uniref:SRPBCC family protein n=1 Tax=Methylomonas montana TaxID=3058963 RepID=UPI002657B9DE|nr:SRPBCC domain-containing protein [Methylomonas montana]WKJ90070.1 SRPBCC domain-containing protein [Methylomonas montana]
MSILTIEKQIRIAAPASRVFDALSDPEQIVQYYPIKSVTSSQEVSGPILFKGEVDGTPFTDYGIIEILDRPQHFRYHYWSDNHGTADTPENRMVIDYQLSSDGGDTVLTLTHSNLLSADRQAMMAPVWDFLLGGLKNYLETDAR